MNEERQFKIVLIVFWVIVAISIPIFAIQGYEVIVEFNKKHPDLGLFGWLVIAVWVSGVFLTMEIATRVCQKMKWAKTSNSEGMAAGMLYIFISAVLFIFVF